LKSTRWVYLLTGLSYPMNTVYLSDHSDSWDILSESIADINISKLGIRLKRVFLTTEDRVRQVHNKYRYKDRFVCYIYDGRQDDNLAQRFADAVMLSLAVLDDVAMEETPKLIRIPESCIKKGRIIRIKDIVGEEGVRSKEYLDVVHGIGVQSEVLDYVWRIVPVIVENQALMDAASFYRESVKQVWVADDDVSDIMWNNLDEPLSQTERACIETAYQNAFKAVEAIIGEPPKDISKLILKLNNAGINPDEIVGYDLYGMKPAKESILKKVTDMHTTRDKRAAHGRTNTLPRIIGYCELKDKQALAQYLIKANIDFILQSEITTSSSP